MSIKIIRAFVAIRHYIGNNEYRLSNVESKIRLINIILSYYGDICYNN